MLSVFRTISALLAAVVLFGLANGLFFTLLGIRMSAEGVSSGLIGLVGSAYFAGMLAGTLFCERVIRRVGHRPSSSAARATDIEMQGLSSFERVVKRV